MKRTARDKIFVCDVDNTVSDQYERYNRFYDLSAKKILPDAFSEKEISQDKPISGAAGAIERLSHKFRIIWLTARPAGQYNMTREWLMKHSFPIDDLILVEKRNDKIPALVRLKPFVYVDDMRYNYENLDPKPTTDFMRSLEENGIPYEIFKNNWDEIADKYLRLAGS